MTSGHRYKQMSEDEVACMDCGHEPWQRPEPCPVAHPAPKEES